jgi:hypothetical protein
MTTDTHRYLWLTLPMQVFEKLFTSHLQGSEHPTVIVDSTAEKDSLIELLHFCYTKTVSDQICGDKDALLRLLVLADRYAVTKAIQAIAAALQKDAKLEDACRILDLPSSIRNQEAMGEVVNGSKELIKSEMLDLDEAYEMGKYEKLSVEGMRLALKNKASKVVCEHTVFVMVWHWMQGRPERKSAFPKLSKLIRYHQMTSSFLCMIQQLQETQCSVVASHIRTALLHLGARKIQTQETLVLVKGKGWVKHSSQPEFGPRLERMSPFKVTIDWVAMETAVMALAESRPLTVAEKEAAGYKFQCTLARDPKGICLHVFCGLFANLGISSPTALLMINMSFPGLTEYRGSAAELSLVDGAFKRVGTINLTHLKWDTDRKRLLASNFTNQMLEGSICVTFF